VLYPYSCTLALCWSWVVGRFKGSRLCRLHAAICGAAVQLCSERTKVPSMAKQLVCNFVAVCVACATACASQVQACGASAYVLCCGGVLVGSTHRMTATVTVVFARPASTSACDHGEGLRHVARKGVSKCCTAPSRVFDVIFEAITSTQYLRTIVALWLNRSVVSSVHADFI
jgi:hypothetical protein